MEIKGLVIDIKKQAILILTPTGKTVVVKADGDHFARATKLATRGDWMCFTGKGEIVNATATFTQVSANQGADYHDNGVVSSRSAITTATTSSRRASATKP